MRIVIQRSKEASVIIQETPVASIPRGMVLLVCFEKKDSEDVIKTSAEKIAALRIFTDPMTGKMSQSLKDHGGEILCVGQFTLSWDGKRGNRPGFDNSMEPGKAQDFFQRFCQVLGEKAIVKQGVFGADMQVNIKNDGPVTFFLEF